MSIKRVLHCILGKDKKEKNFSDWRGLFFSVLHALVPPELTPQGANEISMFNQMYFPSPLAHSDTTCVNM